MDDAELEKLKKEKLDAMIKAGNTISNPKVIDLNTYNFDQNILADNLTLVDFWAHWCGPCKLMHPVFQRMARKYPQVKFGRVDVDQNGPIAARFAVQAIPTFIMFCKGQQIDKMAGAVGEPGIHMIIKKHLKLD